MRFRRSGVLALVVLGLLALVPTAAIVHADQTVNISMTEFAFNPSDITVTQGDVVHFRLTNNGAAPHDIHIQGSNGTSAESKPNGGVAPGQTSTLDVIFADPGTCDFWCP